MGVSAMDLLQPQIIVGAYSTISPPAVALQNLFGWPTYSLAAQGNDVFTAAIDDVPEANAMSGNYEDIPTRSASYDIVDYTRKVGGEASPMTPHKTIAPKAVGNVQFTIPRLAESVPLPLEMLYQNHRKIGGPTSMLDTRGERYIRKELTQLYERVANKIEFQTASMLRGISYVHVSGDDMFQSWTSSGAVATLDYQLSKRGADLTGDAVAGAPIIATVDGGGTGADSGPFEAAETGGGKWSTATTDIPAQLRGVSAFLEQQCGQPLGCVVINSKTWGDIVNNTDVNTQAGTARGPFADGEYIKVESGGQRYFYGTLRALPWVKFIIVDYGLDVYNGTTEAFTKLIPDGYAAFMPDPSSEWSTYYRGCEPVVMRPFEGPATTVQPYGFFTWSYVRDNPAQIDLMSVHNGMPALFRPKAIIYANVEGFTTAAA